MIFSLLENRSTRMLVSSIFKRLETFLDAPDVLNGFSRIGNVFSSDTVKDVSID